MYDPVRLRNFMLQAEKMVQQVKSFGGSIDIYKIGDALGLPPEDSRAIATYIAELGWARYNPGPGPHTITLTPLGYDEVAKLKLRFWRRWLLKNPGITGGVAGVIANVVVEIIKYWLRT